MSDLRDPEFDPRPDPEPGTCRLGRCDGSGFICVSAAYVDRWAPLLTDAAIRAISGRDDPSDELVAMLHEQRRLRRAGFARHVYPCPVCMPVQFAQWDGGHWSNNHDRANCPDCVSRDPTLRAGRSRRRQHREDDHEPEPVYRGGDAEAYTPPSPPPRLDIDG